MFLKKKKGQASLEYIVVFTAIVSVFIVGVWAALASKNSATPTGIGRIMQSSASSITASTSDLADATQFNP